jgi:rod shape-determining protein MreD
VQWLRFAVLLCVVTVVQAGLLEHFDIRPDLLLVLLVFFAVYSDTSHAIITSFIIGLAADIIVIGSLVGLKMVSFGLCGTLLAYLHRVSSPHFWLPHCSRQSSDRFYSCPSLGGCV